MGGGTTANERTVLLPSRLSRKFLGDPSPILGGSGFSAIVASLATETIDAPIASLATASELEIGSSTTRHQQVETHFSDAASREGSTNIAITPPSEPLTQRYGPTDGSVSNNTMGYSNTAQHHYQSSSLTDRQNQSGSSGESSEGIADDDKTMDHSIATAPTLFTDHIGGGVGGVRDDDDEDDTTTIRSIDSHMGAELLSITEDDDDPIDSTRAIMGGHATLPAPQPANGTVEATSSVCSVSTAPSTDEASSLGHEWTPYSNVAQHQHYQHQHHRRVPSWEVSPRNHFAVQAGGPGSPGAVNLPQTFSPQGWSNLGQQQQHQQLQHAASFRGEHQQGYPQAGRLSGHTGHLSQLHHTPPRYGGGFDSSLPFPPSPAGRGGQESPRGVYHRQGNPANYLHPVLLQRKAYSQPPLPPSASNTPPRLSSGDRGGRGPVHSRIATPGQSPHRSQQSMPGNGNGGVSSRSSSEVLKTLLRKKACLYEPDTSRAVALVTWLVGRELALEYGFFSRQQLQAGVHACVSDKIDDGLITRTKVNRCMQIILNSCFHYIIPRPDGTEENGETFRGVFSNEMKDDSFLLSVLPVPWNDISVDRDTILAACEEEIDQHHHYKPKKWTFETPQSSPRLSSVPAPDKGSPSRDSLGGDSDAKRAVLLCFNENVRCAENVFRCHNEFIRDTAHACHLQLSSNEWRLFFGREAAGAPYIWGNVGIPVPFLEGQGHQQLDALGCLTKEEVGVLRTSWCSKRYDHDHELCGFGHPEVNGGWLRRNPLSRKYKDDMCPDVSAAPRHELTGFQDAIGIHECPRGVNCTHAHSLEEIIYHPNRYKLRPCSSSSRAGGCALGDVCPGFHPADSYRFPKKSDIRSPRHSRPGQQHSGNGGKGASAAALPSGSPIIYASPAPISSYERHLLLPGLQNLFRRNCTVLRASLRNNGGTYCNYSCFGDDDGIVELSGCTSTSQSKTIAPSQQLRI